MPVISSSVRRCVGLCLALIQFVRRSLDQIYNQRGVSDVGLSGLHLVGNFRLIGRPTFCRTFSSPA